MAKKKKAIKKRVTKKPQTIEGVYQDAFTFAADCFRAGDSEALVAEQVTAKWPIFSPANVQLVTHKGSQLIADQYRKDSRSIVALHTKRYNKEIESLMNKKYDGLINEEDELDDGDDRDSAAKRRKLRIMTLHLVLNVMSAKENVLQMHNKDTQIKIFNKLNAKIKEKKVLFNLDTLTLNEKIEFLALIQKARKTENEIHSIILSSSEKQITEDAEFVEVENDNISKIKQINPPVAPIAKVKKGLDDVTKQIHKNLADRAIKMFRKKGGVTGGPREIDYTEINNK